MMTDEQIQQRLDAHAKLLAERKDWFLPPIPLDQLAFDLRQQQFRERLDGWLATERVHMPKLYELTAA